MGETTQGRTGKWAKRPGGETTRGERESGRNDSGANGKVGETTRILKQGNHTRYKYIRLDATLLMPSSRSLSSTHLITSQSFNLHSRRVTDEFATTPFHLPLSSAALEQYGIFKTIQDELLDPKGPEIYSCIPDKVFCDFHQC